MGGPGRLDTTILCSVFARSVKRCTPSCGDPDLVCLCSRCRGTVGRALAGWLVMSMGNLKTEHAPTRTVCLGSMARMLFADLQQVV